MKYSDRVLGLISLSGGLVAAGALSLAVATDYWLYTTDSLDPTLHVADSKNIPGTEEMQLPEEVFSEGATGHDVTEMDIMAPLIVHTHSGLWRICIIYQEPDYPAESCQMIDYFLQSSERFDQADVTNSINRAIRKTAIFFVVSLVVSFVALALSILGTANKDHRTIVSAVIYLFSALLLAMGVVMYISAVNDEVSHRKKTQMNNVDTSFRYDYGWAFLFTATTFICLMAAAVANITLYILRYTQSFEDKERLSAAEIRYPLVTPVVRTDTASTFASSKVESRPRYEYRSKLENNRPLYHTTITL